MGRTNHITKFYIITIILFFHATDIFWAKVISPLSYGLMSAKTDIERYEVLYHTHQEALKNGCDVTYQWIGTLNIEIPQDAKSIPLTDNTDFAGTTINVRNYQKNFTLFTMELKTEPFDIRWKQIEKGRLPKDNRTYLILIEDAEPWVKNRKGHSYGHTRKDVLLVKNGIPQNHVIASYQKKPSKPKFSRCFVTERKKTFRNLIFNRDSGSTYKTFLVKVLNQSDMEFDNITINTPKTDFYGDAAISISNCTNISMSDVTINGTYSQKDKYGYGISMNNVWNASFTRLTGHGNWGVFGNNNVNTATLTDCDINRFDIHCYGRDISCKGCTFRNLYNQFSSTFGTIRFEHCTFKESTPLLNGTSYNAHVGYELCFMDCIWEPTIKKNYLIDACTPNDEINSRKELSEKCWPNVRIDGLRIIIPEEMTKIYLFRCKNKVSEKEKLGYIKKIIINNLTIEQKNNKNVSFLFSNFPVSFKNRISITGNSAQHIVQSISNK